jgi:hypothetical protein
MTDEALHAAADAAEWQEWLAATDRFGVLAVNNLDPARAPLVLPTHFTLAGEELLIHMARANPVWPHLEAAAEVRLAVIGDYAYIPTYWRAQAGGRDEDGVPTSYHSIVQFVCRPTVVDDPRGTAELLATSSLTSNLRAATRRCRSTRRVMVGCCRASAASGSRCCGSRPSSSTTTTTPSSTANASSAISSSAGTVSTPGPRPSSGAGWPRSVIGRTTGTGRDQPARHPRLRRRRGSWPWRRWCRSSSAPPWRYP